VSGVRRGFGLAGKRRVCREGAEGDDGFVFWYVVVVLLCPE